MSKQNGTMSMWTNFMWTKIQKLWIRYQVHKSIKSKQQITPCTVLSHFISYASQWYNEFHKNATVQILSVHHFPAASLSCKTIRLKFHIWEAREHDASGWGGCNSNDPACCSMQMQKVIASDFTNHKVIRSLAVNSQTMRFTDTNYEVVAWGFSDANYCCEVQILSIQLCTEEAKSESWLCTEFWFIRPVLTKLCGIMGREHSEYRFPAPSSKLCQI